MTLFYDSDKKITMAKSSDLLEKAWKQLELENPESTRRLRMLKYKQEKGYKHTILNLGITVQWLSTAVSICFR